MFRNRPLSWLYFYPTKSACSKNIWKNMMISFMFWNIMLCSGHIIIHTQKKISGSDIQPKKIIWLSYYPKKNIWLSYEHKTKNIWLPIKYKAPPPPWISNGPPLRSRHNIYLRYRSWTEVMHSVPCVHLYKIAYFSTHKNITLILTIHNKFQQK